MPLGLGQGQGLTSSQRRTNTGLTTAQQQQQQQQLQAAASRPADEHSQTTVELELGNMGADSNRETNHTGNTPLTHCVSHSLMSAEASSNSVVPHLRTVASSGDVGDARRQVAPSSTRSSDPPLDVVPSASAGVASVVPDSVPPSRLDILQAAAVADVRRDASPRDAAQMQRVAVAMPLPSPTQAMLGRNSDSLAKRRLAWNTLSVGSEQSDFAKAAGAAAAAAAANGGRPHTRATGAEGHSNDQITRTHSHVSPPPRSGMWKCLTPCDRVPFDDDELSIPLSIEAHPYDECLSRNCPSYLLYAPYGVRLSAWLIWLVCLAGVLALALWLWFLGVRLVDQYVEERFAASCLTHVSTLTTRMEGAFAQQATIAASIGAHTIWTGGGGGEESYAAIDALIGAEVATFNGRMQAATSTITYAARVNDSQRAAFESQFGPILQWDATLGSVRPAVASSLLTSDFYPVMWRREGLASSVPRRLNGFALPPYLDLASLPGMGEVIQEIADSDALVQRFARPYYVANYSEQTREDGVARGSGMYEPLWKGNNVEGHSEEPRGLSSRQGYRLLMLTSARPISSSSASYSSPLSGVLLSTFDLSITLPTLLLPSRALRSPPPALRRQMVDMHVPREDVADVLIRMQASNSTDEAVRVASADEGPLLWSLANILPDTSDDSVSVRSTWRMGPFFQYGVPTDSTPGVLDWHFECVSTSETVRHFARFDSFRQGMGALCFAFVVISSLLVLALLRWHQTIFVERRQKNLSIAQMEEARRQAEMARDQRSDFMAFLCHELRNPLHAVLSMSDSLSESVLDPDQTDAVFTIHASSELMLCITNDVLDLSKIESGRIELDIIDIDLWALVDSLVRANNSYAQERTVTVTGRVDPRVPRYIRADSTRLNQMITNLLSNAVKFSRKHGEVSLEVELLPDDAPSADVSPPPLLPLPTPRSPRVGDGGDPSSAPIVPPTSAPAVPPTSNVQLLNVSDLLLKGRENTMVEKQSPRLVHTSVASSPAVSYGDGVFSTRMRALRSLQSGTHRPSLSQVESALLSGGMGQPLQSLSTLPATRTLTRPHATVGDANGAPPRDIPNLAQSRTGSFSAAYTSHPFGANLPTAHHRHRSAAGGGVGSGCGDESGGEQGPAPTERRRILRVVHPSASNAMELSGLFTAGSAASPKAGLTSIAGSRVTASPKFALGIGGGSTLDTTSLRRKMQHQQLQQVAMASAASSPSTTPLWPSRDAGAPPTLSLLHTRSSRVQQTVSASPVEEPRGLRVAAPSFVSVLSEESRAAATQITSPSSAPDAATDRQHTTSPVPSLTEAASAVAASPIHSGPVRLCFRVKKLSDLMSAVLSVESEVDCGTTFSIAATFEAAPPPPTAHFALLMQELPMHMQRQVAQHARFDNYTTLSIPQSGHNDNSNDNISPEGVAGGGATAPPARPQRQYPLDTTVSSVDAASSSASASTSVSPPRDLNPTATTSTLPANPFVPALPCVLVSSSELNNLYVIPSPNPGHEVLAHNMHTAQSPADMNLATLQPQHSTPSTTVTSRNHRRTHTPTAGSVTRTPVSTSAPCIASDGASSDVPRQSDSPRGSFAIPVGENVVLLPSASAATSLPISRSHNNSLSTMESQRAARRGAPNRVSSRVPSEGGHTAGHGEAQQHALSVQIEVDRVSAAAASSTLATAPPSASSSLLPNPPISSHFPSPLPSPLALLSPSSAPPLSGGLESPSGVVQGSASLSPLSVTPTHSGSSGAAPPLCVLVVDDAAINRKIMDKTLRAYYRIDHAENGLEAVNRVAAAPPGYYACVLMDLMMPVMSGSEALLELRRRGYTLPVIAVTANTMSEDIDQCIAIGFNAFISKPARAATVRAKINELVAQQAQAQAQ